MQKEAPQTSITCRVCVRTALSKLSPEEPALSLSNGEGLRVAQDVSLPQGRHPERSASQIYRVTQRLWRGVEEPVETGRVPHVRLSVLRISCRACLRWSTSCGFP
jgi:hypothetical protein